MPIEIYGVMVALLIIGFVQMIKRAGLKSRYAGVAAWAAGTALGVAYGLTAGGWTVLQSIIIGSALGLSASGLYSTQKSIRRQKYHLHNL
ncbi:MAG: hypothetical protein CVU89_00875 [Firmicutes bacterium HGW-Firmicutes-14]|nr:MAG: hypothetical protein CVU89_00875 [Firmicutes bacterium HGW-Firmicutes-14]